MRLRDRWTSSLGYSYRFGGTAPLPSPIFNEDKGMELEIQRMMQNLPVQNKQRDRQKQLPAAEQGSETQRPKETAETLLKKLQTYSKEEVEQYLNKMFKSNLLFNRKLKFQVNRELNQVIVKVIDRSTDEVIREIPPEEIQRLEAKLKEAIGLLIDEQI